jgi:hypothetical protein
MKRPILRFAQTDWLYPPRGFDLLSNFEAQLIAGFLLPFEDLVGTPLDDILVSIVEVKVTRFVRIIAKVV